MNTKERNAAKRAKVSVLPGGGGGGGVESLFPQLTLWYHCPLARFEIGLAVILKDRNWAQFVMFFYFLRNVVITKCRFTLTITVVVTKGIDFIALVAYPCICHATESGVEP